MANNFEPLWEFRKYVPIQCNDYTPNTVPLAVAVEAYEEYAAQGHGDQSFEQLHARGGFDWPELAILLYNHIRRLKAVSREGSDV